MMKKLLPIFFAVLAGCQPDLDPTEPPLQEAPDLQAEMAARAYAEAEAAGVTFPYFQPSEEPIPDVVLAHLPAGVSAADLWSRFDNPIGGPCYFYKGPDGNLHPVTMPPLDPDQPYCIM